MVEIPTLLTPRLKLRAHRLDDFDAYAAMWQEPAVVRFIGGVARSREVAWGSFLRQGGSWLHLGFGFFAVEDRETGAFIGEAGFHDLKRNIVPSIEGTMEAGWVLSTAMQGKGIAEEAMRAALGWARDHGTGERFTCMIEKDHAASLHVAEKLGFERYARAEYAGKQMVLLDQPRV